MRDYRETLLEAARALMADGDLDMRLSQVACVLIQIDDDDVPPIALEAFERVRTPLIEKPLVVEGRLVPRDLDEMQGLELIRAFNNLVLAELGEHEARQSGNPP